MSEPRANRLRRLSGARGADWFPSWATSPVDYWAAGMPRAVAERELGFVAGLGLDHVRIWLSAWGFERDRQAYLENLRFLLDTADGLGLGIVMELFDSCGSEPTSTTESLVRIEDVPLLARRDNRVDVLRALSGGDRDIFGAPGLVLVPWRGDPTVAVWEGFVPNPGYAWLGEEHWRRWDAYAEAVVSTIRDHPALLLIELMNEPFVSQIGVEIDREPITRFYCHVDELVRELAPGVPLSIGEATIEWFAEHEHNLGRQLDVVSIHGFADPATLEANLDKAHAVADGRPVYLSEWGYFPGGDDAAQRDWYEATLPVLDRAGVAWAASHLIAGYGPFANTALLYPSGVMRPAAQLLRNWLTAAKPISPASAVGATQ